MNSAVVLRLVSSLARVAVRRATHGPEVPEWSFLYETLVDGLRASRRQLEKRSVAEQRVHWEATSMPSPLFARVHIEDVSGSPIPANWCVPKSSSESAPVILFLHGGAFGFGSMKTHGELVTRLALASAARVFFPLYRLAPEHPFPAALDDTLAAYKYLLGSIDPSRLVVMGDSAGGGLTLSLMYRLKDLGLPLPAGIGLVCPWLDLSDAGENLPPTDWVSGEWGHGFMKAYLSGHDPADPHASPFLGDLSGLPPMLVQARSRELLFRQIALFVEKAEESGADITFEVGEGMVHDWHLLAGAYPEAQRAIESLARFVRQKTRRREPGPLPGVEPRPYVTKPQRRGPGLSA